MRSTLSPELLVHLPEVLRQDHENIRTELSLSMTAAGPVGAAVKRLAHLCLPHFDLEEKILFPAFARLHGLISHRATALEVKQLTQQINAFRERHKRINNQHHSIVFEVERLLESAHKVGDTQATELAYMLMNHERMENEFEVPGYQSSIEEKEVVW